MAGFGVCPEGWGHGGGGVHVKVGKEGHTAGKSAVQWSRGSLGKKKRGKQRCKAVAFHELV